MRLQQYQIETAQRLFDELAPFCPCGCGFKLRWVKTKGQYAFLASPKCVDSSSKCLCGCGLTATATTNRCFASAECGKRYRITKREEFLQLTTENAPLCPCGRGGVMRLKGGRYLYCSGAHHGISARSVELADRQKQLIIGTLLGDGHANFVRGKANARLQIRHSTKRQLPYCEWKRSQLQSICNSDILIRDTPKSFGKQIASFVTLSHPFIHEQASKLYTPKRTVTRDYLDQLTDFGLAVWYVDDGSGSAIHTQGFTRSEQDLIVEYLWEMWGIESRVGLDVARGLEFISLSHPIQLHDCSPTHHPFAGVQDTELFQVFRRPVRPDCRVAIRDALD